MPASSWKLSLATALEQMRRELSNQIGQVCFAQFLLFRQARSTEGHAEGEGLTLMGNLPFFVSADSIDVWAKPELFLLDEQRRPRFVSGVRRCPAVCCDT